MTRTKTVLITGCSPGGAGHALAKAFHNKGLRVFATARNPSKIQSLMDLGIETLQLDVTDEKSICEAVEQVSKLTNGTLDFLVSNAGEGYSIPLLDSTPSAARALFDLNVFALITLTQQFMPLLENSKGTIVSISSIASAAPFPWQGWYNASKAAVSSLNNQLRLELSPFDVKVISVIAGGFTSNFFDNSPVKTLPNNSLYAPGNYEIERIMRGDHAVGALMAAEVFAEEIVLNSLRKKPKLHLWAGSGGFTIWFLSTFGWQTIWDSIFGSRGQLDAVTAKIKAVKKDR